jgi:polyhydroxyalkanoate synthesis regulator phasin
MLQTTDPTIKLRGREAGQSGVLAWAGLGAAAAAVLVAVGAALVLGARVDRLRGEKDAAAVRAAAAEKASQDLAAALEKISGRLAEAEARCRKLEAAVPNEARLKELAAAAAREELAKGRPAAGQPAVDPAALAARVERIKEEADVKAAEIAAIKEKAAKGELTPEQAREAIEAKVREGLKTVLPPEAVERLEKARAEQEKNLTPDQKKQADQMRAGFLDGIADWAAIQQQVKDGKITQEEANRQIREKMRQRMEEFQKNLPEDQRKAMEERMKAWRERRGGGGGGGAGKAPDPVPAPKEEF